MQLIEKNLQISTLNQYLPNLSNHENCILKPKLQNLIKCSKEEVDQYDIGLYVCEKNSDLTKYDVINNLRKPDIDYKYPFYIDKKNPKVKESSVINGLLYFHGYVIQIYLKVHFVYIVSSFPQNPESIRQN